MKTIFKYFVSGLLFLIPVGATVYVIYWIFTTIDRLVRGPLEEILGMWVTGLGVVISLLVILFVGVLTRLFITRPLIRLIEKLFEKLPLVKLLYSSVKDLIGAFVGDKKKFDQPVLVTIVPDSNTRAMGFITRKNMDFWNLKDDVAVYFPQSYNFAGNIMIVPRSQITPLDVDSSDVMAFIVSGGVSGPGLDEKG
ncbi:MAG: DUF502 domain-containing protein [Sedimentisphaerales bacterium]|nr:DUF502 domain-containing protein [Sedimentisphaerales bacterium]